MSDATSPENRSLTPGLYIVSTPIGNLGDITLRAVEVLRQCDGVACEDTRVTGKLLKHLGISKPMWRYDDHSEHRDRTRLVDSMRDRAVALVSDAGTPLISDPGYRLVNAAREPEIVDLCKLLVAMGADIEGIGSDKLVIHGRDRLHGATYSVMPDRIEAGSYACAVAITGGSLDLIGANADDMHAILAGLRDAGVQVDAHKQGIRISSDGKLRPLTLSTAPFPAFPTDMQAQFMAMLTLADGASVLTETIFENRYMHVPELARMGADIAVNGRTAVVRGVSQLVGAPVMATDLRASMSLILAGLAAQGETRVNRVYHLDRGYERLEEKLSAVGADIERVGDG